MEKGLEKQQEAILLNKPVQKLPVKAYKRRWWVIFLYIYYSAISALQWLEYSSITALVVKYYNVSSLAVDWTSTLYMIVYPILVIPASYIVDKKGVRLTVLLGCTGTFLGTAIKVFSIGNDLFWVVIVGNILLALASVMVGCLPAKIAALWFKHNEVSTACALGVLGMQLGSAVGYILPPLMVRDHDNIDEIGNDLKLLSWILTILMIPVTIAVFIYFPDEPPLPPSVVQATLRQNKTEFNTKQFFISLKDLFSNKGFVLHLISYGLNISVYSAVATLLSQFIQYFFKGESQMAGWMGFTMTVAGIGGMLVVGVVLDKTHKYKEITLINYILTTVSTVMLMFTLKYELVIMTYVACILWGIFITAYLMVGYEFGMELTFPTEETTTSGLLMAFSQILGTAFTIALGYLNIWIGPFWSLSTQVAVLLVGTIVTAFIPNDLRRQEAFKKNNSEYGLRKVSYHGSRPTF